MKDKAKIEQAAVNLLGIPAPEVIYGKPKNFPKAGWYLFSLAQYRFRQEL